MKRQIIIYFHIQQQHDEPVRVSWIVQEPGQTRTPVFHGDLQTAANHALGCRVIVLVPAEMMTLTHVELPAMNKQRLLKAIPFALEEQVASDVDSLHFCLGKRDEFDQQACAVIETDVISQWLAILKEVNIQPDVITSEIYAIPAEAECWSVLFTPVVQAENHAEAKVLLRTGSNNGLAIDLSNSVALISHFIDNATEEKRPKKLRLITCADVATAEISDDDAIAQETTSNAIAVIVDQLREVCTDKGVAIERDDSEDDMLTIMAHNIDEWNAINVLQGQFSRKEQFEKLIRPWRAAAAIAFVWLVLQLGLMIADYRELVQVDAQLRGDILETYKSAFPDSKNIVDPKLQMQRGLDELRKGGNSGSDLIVLLSKAGNILRDTDTLDMKGVRYKSDTLDLDFEIADLQALDELKIRLINQTGLSVEIVSASAKGGKVESRLQLKSGASS